MKTAKVIDMRSLLGLLIIVSLITFSRFFTCLHIPTLLDESTLLNQFSSRSLTSSNQPRVLMGIFSYDGEYQWAYREAFRSLLAIHPLVCSLGEYQRLTTLRIDTDCELVYTFVLGGNPTGPTEQVGLADTADKVLTPMEALVLEPENVKRSNHDLHNGPWHDVTFLNIKENMEDGKSQTWFYYASRITKDLDFHYVGKIDTDSMIYLDQYFDWARRSLPPPPFNEDILAGKFIEKTWRENEDKESFFEKIHENKFHLYAGGECYIMSADLAAGVAHMSRTVPKNTYFERIEDHDVSALAFMAREKKSTSMTLKMIDKDKRFWKHPLKLRNPRRWSDRWREEEIRLRQILKGEGQIKRSRSK